MLPLKKTDVCCGLSAPGNPDVRKMLHRGVAQCCLVVAVVFAILVALNPLLCSAYVLAVGTALCLHWRTGRGRTIPLVLRLLPLCLLPLVVATLLVGSVIAPEPAAGMLALPLMTMAALPFVLLPRWRIVEYDDGSTPLSPEYKAWWTEHRRLCREHAQRCRALRKGTRLRWRRFWRPPGIFSTEWRDDVKELWWVRHPLSTPSYRRRTPHRTIRRRVAAIIRVWKRHSAAPLLPALAPALSSTSRILRLRLAARAPACASTSPTNLWTLSPAASAPACASTYATTSSQHCSSVVCNPWPCCCVWHVPKHSH
jgi:hypothetical protein